MDINQFAQGWWNWMVPMFLQVSVLILIIGGIDLVIKKWAWPQIRYALWLLILVKLLIPPTWSLPSGLIAKIHPLDMSLPERVIQVQPVSMEESSASGAEQTPPVVEKMSPDESSRGYTPPGDGKLGWQFYVMGIWISGMLLFMGLLAFRIARLRRWHREQRQKKIIPDWYHQLLVKTAEKMKLETLPAIVFSHQAAAPAVYGLFRPVLLLPVDYFKSLSREEAQHVLLHELAHLKRGDLWVHGICLLLQIIYWFNPLIIWVRKQMKHVREICCDLTVANRLKEETMKYHQTLVNTAKRLLTESVEPGMGLLGIFEEPFRLVSRLKWLKKARKPDGRILIPAICCMVVLMLVFILPMASADTGYHPAAKKDSFSLNYQMPKGRSLQYTQNLEQISEETAKGQTHEIVKTDSFKFTVNSKGNRGKNFLLGITLDFIKVYVKTPWTDLIPNVRSLLGKQFDMVLSPRGKELELIGADSLVYYLLPEIKQYAASGFSMFFPDLTMEAIRIGDSWTSDESFMLRSTPDLHFTVENLNTVEGVETLKGMKCIRVKTRFKGTVLTAGKVKRKGNVTGNSTWYFAYKKGILVKETGNVFLERTKMSDSHGKKESPFKIKVKFETDLVKW